MNAVPGDWEHLLRTATSLSWRVKERFRAYVQRSGGSVRIVQPASADERGFRFARTSDAAALRFTGGVLFMAHAGFLKVLIAEPSIAAGEDGLELHLSDPFEPVPEASSWAFARLDVTAHDAGRLELAARLTARGAELFGGSYDAGEELDPVVIELSPEPGGA